MSNSFASIAKKMDDLQTLIVGKDTETKDFSDKAVAAHSARLELEKELLKTQSELSAAIGAISGFLGSLTKLPPLVTQADVARDEEIAAAEAAAKAEADRIQAERLEVERKVREAEEAALKAAQLVAEEAERTRLAAEAEVAAKAAAEEAARLVAEEAERTRLAAEEAERLLRERADTESQREAARKLAEEKARDELAKEQAARTQKLFEEAQALLAAEQERDRLAAEAAAAAKAQSDLIKDVVGDEPAAPTTNQPATNPNVPKLDPITGFPIPPV